MFVRKLEVLLRELGCGLTAENEFRLQVGKALGFGEVMSIPRDDERPLTLRMVGEEEERQTIREIWHQALESADYEWHGHSLDDENLSEDELRRVMPRLISGDTYCRDESGIFYVAGVFLEQMDNRPSGRLDIILNLKGREDICGEVCIMPTDFCADLRLRTKLSAGANPCKTSIKVLDFRLVSQRMSERHPGVSCKTAVYAYTNLRMVDSRRQMADRREFRLSEYREVGKGINTEYAVTSMEFEAENMLDEF